MWDSGAVGDVLVGGGMYSTSVPLSVNCKESATNFDFPLTGACFGDMVLVDT